MRFFLPVIFATTLCAQQPGQPPSIPAMGADGKPLNLGFEDGTLKDWTATGDAFTKSPTKGNTVKARREDQPPRFAGEYWIGTYEGGLNDTGLGQLTSVPFKVTQPWASFLVGAGDWPETRVEVVTKEDGKVIATGRGVQSETMGRVIVDLRKLKDREIFVRIVDEK